MTQLVHIRDRFAAHTPRLNPTEGMLLAGVTLVLRNHGSGPEVLLIERATREGDPWSGHVAFPGGRREPGDASLRKTAERETLEEVGIGLEPAHYLGRLDDLGGRAAASGKMVVAAYVYQLDAPRDAPLVDPLANPLAQADDPDDHGGPGGLELDPGEVADAFWVRLDHLMHPDNHVHYPMTFGEREVIFPGIRVGARGALVVWGLTYRFLEGFFEIVGTPLPDHGIPDPETQTTAGRS